MADLDFLKTSLIYTMSLGSHELFHSNVWAWLINQNSQFAKIFFPFIDTSKKITVKREEKYRDISIHVDDGKNKKIYVIENKFKSLPYIKQLEKYQAEAGKAFSGGVVCCVREPYFKVDGWSALTYDEIGEAIKQNAHLISEKYRDSVNEYAEIIIVLNNLISNTLKSRENLLSISADNFNDFEDIHLADVLRKLSAQSFAEYINEKTKSITIPDGWELSVSNDYANKKGNVDIFLVGKNQNDKKHVGIQLEGIQYRRVAEDGPKCDVDKLFKDFADKGWFDGNFKVGNKLFGAFTTTMDPEAKVKGLEKRQARAKEHWTHFNAYLTDKSSFIYQHYNLDKDVAFDKLADIIIDDLNNLIKCL